MNYSKFFTRFSLFFSNYLPILSILILSAIFRLNGLDWDVGYNYTPHPDERAILTKVSQLGSTVGYSFFDAENNSWNPKWFAYGSFPLYLLKFFQEITSFLSGEKLTDLRLLGRLISVVADMGTICFVYLIGKQMFGKREAILSAFLVGFCVLHVQLSHFYAVDTLLTFFVIAILFYLYQISKSCNIKYSIIVGVLTGIGLATKVSIFPIYFTILMSYVIFVTNPLKFLDSSASDFLYKLKYAFGCLLLSLLTSILMFFICQPYMLLDYSKFISDVSEQSMMVRRLLDYPYTRQYIGTLPYYYQLHHLVIWGLGVPFGLLAIFGLIGNFVRGINLNSLIYFTLFAIIIPAGIIVYSASLLGIFFALLILFFVLFFNFTIRKQKAREDVLLLAWILPYFLIVGSFEVKFLRYLLPIVPVLFLCSSRTLVLIWENVKIRSVQLKYSFLGLMLLGFLFGVIYLISFSSIYSQKHPAVRMSNWVQENVPEGSLLLNELWDEYLPNMGKYKLKTLNLYQPENPLKKAEISSRLAEADYIYIYSHRLYATISNLPERYPDTSAYYRTLFSGELGYELVHSESTFPSIGDHLTIVNETFFSSNLDPPEKLNKFFPSNYMNFGKADESFTVYDHPVNLLFKNSSRYSANQIQKIITQESEKFSERDTQSSKGILSENDRLIQTKGGSWKSIVDERSVFRDLPVLVWLVFIQFLGLISLPFTVLIFSSFKDKGFLFSKIVGLLILSYLTWILLSLKIIDFSRALVFIVLSLMSLTSILIFLFNKQNFMSYIKLNWKMFLRMELLFLSTFLIFVLIRMLNPDLWHPNLGGEKPMDLAYLTAVMKSSTMPPYDPWFSGGYLNYYYFGQFMVAVIIHATGILPEVAFNLAIATFFAFTFSGSFSIVFNLAVKSSQLPNFRKMIFANKSRTFFQNVRGSPIFAGIFAALLLSVFGNLDGGLQLFENLTNMISNRDFSIWDFDFWRSSRMMQPGIEITEFPFFTFLFADLHAHLISIPYTILSLGICVSLLFSYDEFGKKVRILNYKYDINELLKLFILGVSLGALRVINTWDYPIFLLISIVSIFWISIFKYKFFNIDAIFIGIKKSAFVFFVGYILFLPYHINYHSSFSSIEKTTNQTDITQFIYIFGVFIFLILSFYLYIGLQNCSKFDFTKTSFKSNFKKNLFIYTFILMFVLMIFYFIYSLIGLTSVVLFLISIFIFFVSTKFISKSLFQDPVMFFVTTLVIVGIFLAIGLEIFRVSGDVQRMNSVFKFYLQIWTLLSIVSGFFAWVLINSNNIFKFKVDVFWRISFCFLLLCVMIYPIFGTGKRINTRFDQLPITLDGTEFMKTSIYQSPYGPINLKYDYDAINWIRDEISGSPVMLEGQFPLYTWGGRVSIYTGLPTLLGWYWHQEQQRWGNKTEVAERKSIVDTIYSTTNIQLAKNLINSYKVDYIYIGELEKNKYPVQGIKKFNNISELNLKIIYENKEVKIYSVIPR